VGLNEALKTPQFWLVWAVLCLNVTAGIGIIAMASPMLQEVFGGRLIGVNAPFEQLNQAQHAAIATLAAGFTGLLSLFNIRGRFSWASLSDYIGRKTTYRVFFLLGTVPYASIPWTAAIGSLALFVGSSASSSPCTAAVSLRSQRTWRIFSAPGWWAPSIGACSPHGRRPVSSGP
jgi:hypothetical protein